VEDGSWIRLRDLTLSYQLPTALFERMLISGANIALTGRNVFLITKYTGVDPETNLNGESNAVGYDYFTTPATRSFGIAVNVTF
jgi:hypothetical protein